MRQVGSLPNERQAQRFTAYLVTQGIEAHAEQDTERWAIWVRDENKIEQARELFESFRIDPDDSRYRGAERDAEAIRQQAYERRIAAQKNVVEMRGRWKSVARRQAPLTFTLIVLSVLATLLSGMGKAQQGIGGTITQQLGFCSPADWLESNNPIASIAKGELWRTITPIFIHLDIFHIVFNMLWFYQFASVIESQRGAVYLTVLVLALAIIPNVSQAVAPADLGGTPMFGGMSGVVYGLFGFLWMKSIFDPIPGFQMSQVTVIILVGWLFLCMTPAIPHVANVAHVVGLVVGMVIGYAPTMWKR